MEEETEGNEDTCQEVIKAEDDFYDGRANGFSVNLEQVIKFPPIN